ncbi:hypothetical protein HCN44_000473 [Aphidius gifuensis]|uniref:Uncharacterized protein n=1 Tax=Aphidius gifuensis TaxID=684658 RepID=A0A834XQD1_APHGI|nr:hypothetical protein HCN44_000473 [Aphidius gifuensis]
MGDFVTNNNNCGQNLLQLVPSGNATLAELMRLKEYYIVNIIIKFSDSIQNNVLKNTIVFDFAYFKAANIHEEKIENDPILQECDENLRENYSDCEALCLHGVVLLLVDHQFGGQTRERLLVFNHRYNAQVDEIYLHIRSTGLFKIITKTNSSTSNNSNNNCDTFLGRLAKGLIKLTDPKLTIYMKHTWAWYDLLTQNELLNHKIFSIILRAMGTPGLYGLDKSLSHYINQELNNIYKHIDIFNQDKSLKIIIDDCLADINNNEYYKMNPDKLCYNLIN